MSESQYLEDERKALEKHEPRLLVERARGSVDPLGSVDQARDVDLNALGGLGPEARGDLSDDGAEVLVTSWSSPRRIPLKMGISIPANIAVYSQLGLLMRGRVL